MLGVFWCSVVELLVLRYHFSCVTAAPGLVGVSPRRKKERKKERKERKKEKKERKKRKKERKKRTNNGEHAGNFRP